MTGSISAQIHALFKESGIIKTGTKRNRAKEAARAAGARTSRELARACPITSYETADKYRDVAVSLGEYHKTEYKHWDVEETTADDIYAYLDHLIEKGVALRTWKVHASALGKLETILNKYAEKCGKPLRYDFKDAIESLRPIARAELDDERETREYLAPKSLIKAIQDATLQVVAAIQYDGGARIREAALIRTRQLRGIHIDDITGKEVGTIFLPSVSTKGGREREIFVTIETYQSLCRIVESQDGVLKISHSTYRQQLRDAAAMTNQHYTGSHGLRYSFAQRRLGECLRSGMGEVEARLRVAHEMGHSRPSITDWYLKEAEK